MPVLSGSFIAPITVNVRDRGLVGDWNESLGTGTDDRAAMLALVATLNHGDEVVFPSGNYRFSSFVSIIGMRGIRFRGEANARIYYGSANLATIPPSNAISHAMARSGFFLQNCQGIIVENIEFVGEAGQELTYQNVGAGVYASRCTGTRLLDCQQRLGATLFVEDASTNSGYTTDNVIAVSAGIVTLTDGAGTQMHTGMVGRRVTVSNATNPVNNGVFTVLSAPTAATITYANPVAIAETLGTLVVWSVNDGDYDTKLVNCRLDDCRAVSYTGSGGTYDGCTFTRQMTPDQTGIPDAFSLASTTITLTDATGSFGASVVGRYIKVSGSTSAGNDGLFLILTATPATRYTPATLTYTNASGVSENAAVATSKYWIAGGERSGIGAGATAIASTSGVVTFTAATSIFVASDVGKALCLTDCTTVGNNGNKTITRYISATQVQYVQTGAVSETYAKVFTIDGYDTSHGDSTIGVAITSTSTSVAADTLTDTTQTMVVNAYAGRILSEQTGGWNKKQWLIVSNTATTFTLDAGGVVPTAGAYFVPAGATYGSTHAIYYFAGRSDIVVKDCVFRGVRTTGVKLSGSALPIRNIDVSGCLFDECGAAIIAGADDSQEHSNFNFHHNKIVNCALNRAGWNDQDAISIYGARNVKITDNQHTATHDAVASHIGTGSIGSYFQVFAGRYLNGISQPLEDVTISRNTFSFDLTKCVGSRVSAAYIHAERVGQRAKWGTHGETNGGDIDAGRSVTLTKSGSIMTLTDNGAQFSQEDVGSSIQICFAPDSGNNSTTGVETRVGDFVVLSVTDTTTLTYLNASGVGGGVSAGCYRIKPKVGASGRRGATLLISENEFNGNAPGIQMVSCVGPEVVHNISNGSSIADTGSVAPHIAFNREIGAGSSNARIVISSTTSWPVIHDNYITNGMLAGGILQGESPGATKSDWGIGVDTTTAVDYPLKGVSGRVMPTDAKAQMMYSFGSDLVNGDTISMNGSTITFKAQSPGAGQFNTLSGFLTRLTGSGMTAIEYGSQFSVAVATGHVLVHGNAQTASADAYYTDTINTLNETALVIPRNDSAGMTGGGSETLQYSRGEGSTGPTADKVMVWTMQATFSGGVILTPDNEDARVLMQANSYRTIKNVKNAGLGEVVYVGACAAGSPEEFRWRLT